MFDKEWIKLKPVLENGRRQIAELTILPDTPAGSKEGQKSWLRLCCLPALQRIVWYLLDAGAAQAEP
jgi:hypothetical protein